MKTKPKKTKTNMKITTTNAEMLALHSTKSGQSILDCNMGAIAGWEFSRLFLEITEKTKPYSTTQLKIQEKFNSDKAILQENLNECEEKRDIKLIAINSNKIRDLQNKYTDEIKKLLSIKVKLSFPKIDLIPTEITPPLQPKQWILIEPFTNVIKPKKG